MADLPMELHCLILSFVTDSNDVFYCMQTCHSWRVLLPTCIRWLDVVDHDGRILRRCEILIPRLVHLRELRIVGLLPSDAFRLASLVDASTAKDVTLLSVECVDEEGGSFERIRMSLAPMLGRFCNLRCLCIRNDGLFYDTDSFSWIPAHSICTLVLGLGLVPVNRKHWHRMHFPNLTVLDCSCLPNVLDIDAPQLKKLHMFDLAVGTRRRPVDNTSFKWRKSLSDAMLSISFIEEPDAEDKKRKLRRLFRSDVRITWAPTPGKERRNDSFNYPKDFVYSEQSKLFLGI
jgi:hypothetical protein